MLIKGEIFTLKYHNRSLACICITTGHWQLSETTQREASRWSIISFWE